MNIGYTCINISLREHGITTSRGLKKATLDRKGIGYVSELALANVQDLLTTLKWNEANNVHFFRLGSDLIPWGNKLDISKFPNYKELLETFLECSKVIKRSNQRITAHPGQFNLLASPNPVVVDNTVKDLIMHAEIFDYLELSNTHFNKLNIHVGATYGDKHSAAETWCKNFERLSEGVKSRLTVENDDKANMYSVVDLHEMIHSKVQIPIVFDYHHHTFNTGGLSAKDALQLAMSTWGDIKPVVHYSESKSLHENNNTINPRAHSDLINERIDTFGFDIDIMIEAKSKEQALLRYRSLHEKILQEI